MRVFLGSSSQGSKDVDLVASMIRTANLEPMKWNTPGTFFVSGGTWETLLNLTKDVEAAAFVFRPDDQTITSQHNVATTRDNVILEFGLFSGALGPGRCAIFRRGDAWIPTDLRGITYISLDDAERAQDEVLHWADRMRTTLEVPNDLSPKQVASIAHAMTESGLDMNLIYENLRKLGVSPEFVNYSLKQC